jgi:hypothetical protein
MASPAMTTSRMLSMPGVAGGVDLEDVDVAPLCDLDARVARAAGVGVGPCSQLSARARMRAVVVLPQPREPAKTNACAMRPLDGVAQRARHRLLADDLVEPLRAPLAGEHLVGHGLVAFDSSDER